MAIGCMASAMRIAAIGWRRPKSSCASSTCSSAHEIIKGDAAQLRLPHLLLGGSPFREFRQDLDSCLSLHDAPVLVRDRGRRELPEEGTETQGFHCRRAPEDATKIDLGRRPRCERAEPLAQAPGPANRSIIGIDLSIRGREKRFRQQGSSSTYLSPGSGCVDPTAKCSPL